MNPSLVRVVRTGARYIVALHTSTGTTEWIDPIIESLPPAWGAIALSSRALEPDLIPDDVHGLAALYEGPVRETIGDAPYVVGGSGFGGLVALAIAQRGGPRGLFAIETKIPDPSWATRPDDLATLAPILAAHHARWAGRPDPTVPPTGTPLERLVAGLGSLGEHEVDVTAAERELLLFRRHVRAVHAARFGTVTVPALVIAAAGQSYDLGWKAIAPDARIVYLTGDHYTTARAENAPAIAASVVETFG